MSSYLIERKDWIPIERHVGVFNDLSIDVQEIFDLDQFTEYKWEVTDRHDNIRVLKETADFLRTNQNLYAEMPEEDLEGLRGEKLMWRLFLADTNGWRLVGMGEFIAM